MPIWHFFTSERNYTRTTKACQQHKLMKILALKKLP
jgi:hypothetical protein